MVPTAWQHRCWAIGRGVGLAAVLGILKAHGVGVQALSAPGGGLTVRLCFPTM